MRALPLAAGINEGGHYFRYFGPSGVRALPLAAGINVGGHYFRYFGLSGVRALPLAAGRNEGGHYWSERSACAALGCWHKRRWPLF